jgi:hypothetical protein
VTRTIACTVVAAVAALALAAAAAAKGPSEATVTGPAIRTLTFGGGETGGSAVTALAENAGFFPGAFGGSGWTGALHARPAGALGPRYTIRYVVPTGEATPDSIRQSLYPYAKRGAVTFMPPGQKIFDTTTVGGWYRGGAALKRVLVAHGMPKASPPAHPRSLAAASAAVAGLVAIAFAAAAAWFGRSSIARWPRNRSTSVTRASNV